jgi:hypothetical protein
MVQQVRWDHEIYILYLSDSAIYFKRNQTAIYFKRERNRLCQLHVLLHRLHGSAFILSHTPPNNLRLVSTLPLLVDVNFCLIYHTHAFGWSLKESVNHYWLLHTPYGPCRRADPECQQLCCCVTFDSGRLKLYQQLFTPWASHTSDSVNFFSLGEKKTKFWFLRILARTQGYDQWRISNTIPSLIICCLQAVPTPPLPL